MTTHSGAPGTPPGPKLPLAKYVDASNAVTTMCEKT